MKIRQKIEEINTIERIIGYRCDSCGNEHDGEQFKIPDGWHNFSKHHYAWGNDSGDSWENYDACSVNCYIKLVDEIIGVDGNMDGFEVNGMTESFAIKLVSSFSEIIETKQHGQNKKG